MSKHIVFFDDQSWDELRPITLTRPVCEIRTGILTIRQKWMMDLQGQSHAYVTQAYLQPVFPFQAEDENLLVNGSVLPDKDLVTAVDQIPVDTILVHEGKVIAIRTRRERAEAAGRGDYSGLKQQEYIGSVICLKGLCDIFSLNGEEIRRDFEIITQGRTSQPLSDTCRVVGSHPVFLEEGARAECSIFNTIDGPVYIGKDAEVMEGCLVRGPFSLGEHATLKMGAKIYTGTTIGPHCKVGGEVNNSVFFAYSNKAHDGFIGNSVIGEWVNIGADTNNSNLKNNYAQVKLWNYTKKRFVSTGLTFAGLIMADHSKCGINTMFNTGTVVGVSCNLYGAGFHRNYVPSFTWGSPAGYSRFDFDKAFEVAQIMMKRRGLEPSAEEKEMLLHLSATPEE